MAMTEGVVIGRSSASANESPQAAVSWAAVLCGAFVILAVALVLSTLAGGLGLASISPWPNAGASAKAFAISTGIGLIVVQWIAAAGGGYLTGRLRTRWVGVHDHEVFFRDTAHGLLSWAVATVVGALLLASAASSIVGGGVRAASSVASGAAQGGLAAAAQSATVSGYDVDSLFRTDRPDPAANPAAASAQAARILALGVKNGDVPAGDRAYLVQLVTARTGLSQADAQKRVDDVIAREKAAENDARQAADVARKAASDLAIFTALSMVIGAFIASAAAAYGGSLRDDD